MATKITDINLPKMFTVVNVIVDSAKPGQVRVVFAESARYYHLLDSNPQFTSFLQLLQQAKTSRQSVKILLNTAVGDIIEEVSGVVD